MKQLSTTNPKDILALFPGWKHKNLPYNINGRPSYSHEEMKKYEEEKVVKFMWYDQPASVTFKRHIGRSTNYIWGMRDFGTEVTINIGNVFINTTKITRTESFEYGIKFTREHRKVVEAPLKRILVALKNGSKTIDLRKESSEKIVWIPSYDMWLTLKYITDWQDGFYYTGEYTPIQEPFRTYYYNIHESIIEK